jgi:hypothetical protein
MHARSTHLSPLIAARVFDQPRSSAGSARAILLLV